MRVGPWTFLLKYVGIAVQIWEAKQKPHAPLALPKPPKPVQLTANPPPPSKPKEVPATKAEIFAILGMEELEE